MANILITWFTEFASVTGIRESLADYKMLGLYGLLFLGVAAAFFGFWTYRVQVSLLIFFFFAYGSTIFMADKASWGAIVTCFTVAGLAIAGMALLWHKVDGVLLCALIGAGIGWSFMPELWTAILGAALGGILFLLFPVAAACVGTALGGSVLVTDMLLLLNLEELAGPDRIIMIFMMAAAGAAFQLFVSREQTIFKKVMPDRMRVWLERRGKEHA